MGSSLSVFKKRNPHSAGSPPAPRRIVFKNRVQHLTVPHDFPPIEDYPNYKIPLHACWGRGRNEISQLAIPISPIQRNKDYVRDLNELFSEDCIECEFDVKSWGLYSPLLASDRNRQQWAPGNDDENNPVFFAFFITHWTLENWEFLHSMVGSILRRAFGPAYPPIRYFVSGNRRYGSEDDV
ncbi:hypothetical protein Vi05172_g10592 [Venturia inaequalis]|nr:hypothetical protein Vi05172_g10592 [Venturia inaequalis]